MVIPLRQQVATQLNTAGIYSVVRHPLLSLRSLKRYTSLLWVQGR